MSIQCIDGDTFAINGTYFRLSNIDTPERGEQGYKEASDYTCRYIKDSRNSNYKVNGKDKYGRTLVTYGQLNHNLIKQCLAEPFYGKTTKEIVTYYKLKCK